MFSVSKLKLSLLAATAVFLFNPELMPKAFQHGTQLRAQDMPLGVLKGQGIDALLADQAAEKPAAAINVAFAPAAQTMPASALSASPVWTAPQVAPVAPGENPFASQRKPATASAPAAAPAVNPFERPQAAQPSADASATPDNAVKVDISALRYYASTRDLKRVGAEMRRLKNLYPNWQPPKDLFTQVAPVDEQPLWTIYATGNYAAVRAEIARAQSVNPKWEPSEDLMNKLQLGETRKLIDSAYSQKRWRDVLSTAKAMPSIMVCGEMQVQWNVAEAFAQLRNYADAFDVYHYILTNCDDPALRLSTVQKASLLIPDAGVTSLLALGRTTADGRPEFEDIGFDGIRRQIGTFITNGDFTTTPSSEAVTQFVDFVQRTGSAQDANLIGWYFYAQKEWESANGWFLQATQMKRDPKSIEGLILTLRQMDKADDALKLARRYVKLAPEIATQYIEIVAGELTAKAPTLKLDEADSTLFETLVTEQKSALGAQALGWKSLAASDKAAAKSWFSQSVEWKPTEGGVVGLAVLAARAQNFGALSSLKSKYGAQYASLQDFKVYKVAKGRKKTTVRARKVVEKPKTLADYFRAG